MKKVLENGRKPAAIYAFCTGNLPVGKRKKLERYVAKQFDGIFQIIDREVLAVQGAGVAGRRRPDVRQIDSAGSHPGEVRTHPDDDPDGA
ncbi:MAG: hypothetical protein ACRDM1_15760 [Gaiellaceae bacterium]